MTKPKVHKLNVRYMRKIQQQRTRLGEQKHADYSSVVDAVAVGGVEGIALRMFEKSCRLLTLSRQGAQIKSESMRDTLLDLGNYADYGVTLIDRKW